MRVLKLTHREAQQLKTEGQITRIEDVYYIPCDTVFCAGIGSVTHYFERNVYALHGSSVIAEYTKIAFKKRGTRKAARNELVNRSGKSLAVTSPNKPINI